MHRGRSTALLLCALLLGPSLSARAWAGPRKKVDWTSVEAADAKDAKQVEQRLRKLLTEASRRADWGKGPTLKLAASVRTMRWERQGDVLRLDVTVVGRIVGGPSARSRIRLGGRPSERTKLEKDALGVVATGIVIRLAELARQSRERRD
jgi:hypothetical protein